MIFLNTIFGTVEFDVTIREDFSSSNTVTKNPVEIGADIADHNFVNPERITFEGGVTDTPIRTLNTFGGEGTRSQTAWETLKAIKNAGEQFSIDTGLGPIDNVVIVDLSVPRSSETSNALIFRCTIEQIFLTEVQEGVLTKEQLAEIINNQAASNKERGQVTKEPVTDESIFRYLARVFIGA
jgi:hypothetical protein